MSRPFTIIAAISFSDLSGNASHYAAGLAKATGANLLLFNAFSLPIHSANLSISGEGLQKQLDRSALKLSEKATELSKSYGIEVSSVCSYSFLEDHLSLLIKETKAELVVMGMADKSLEQDLLGNPTTLAIKNVQVPVLAVPLKANFQDLKNVLFACDTFKPLSLKRIGWLRNAISLMELDIEVFSVNTAINKLISQDLSMQAQNIFKEEFQKVKYLYKSVRSNDVISEIEKEIKRYSADILVMMPKQYGFWDSMVHRSKTRLMASGLEIPLLSIPNL